MVHPRRFFNVIVAITSVLCDKNQFTLFSQKLYITNITMLFKAISCRITPNPVNTRRYLDVNHTLWTSDGRQINVLRLLSNTVVFVIYNIRHCN